MDARTQKVIAEDARWGAQNYAPLPVALVRAKGVFAWDAAGRKYLDCLSAYSALNQGHCHPKIAAAATAQMKRMTLISRAFHHPLMAPLLKRICELTGQPKAILMNSGAEAVETAIKAMRLWGYKRKGILHDRAEIIVCKNNFHGRTTTIVGFSSEPKSREGFGPATPGFKTVNYGSLEDLENAVTPDTCGLLIEPIQGEAGVLIPPPGYLKAAAALCRKNNILFCADEIQTGLGRTGKLFACEHEDVKPDLVILGKALSGGFYPVSAVAGEALSLFEPGTHGSTFGGNPLACAIALAALDVVVKEKLPQRSAALGAYCLEKLKALNHRRVREVRGRGLMLAVELKLPQAKDLCQALLEERVLAKDTRDTTVRLAPPLVITQPQVDQLCAAVERALARL